MRFQSEMSVFKCGRGLRIRHENEYILLRPLILSRQNLLQSQACQCPWEAIYFTLPIDVLFIWTLATSWTKKYPASTFYLNEAKQEVEDAMTDGESRKSWNCPFLATLTISVIYILLYTFMRKPSLSD